MFRPILTLQNIGTSAAVKVYAGLFLAHGTPLHQIIKKTTPTFN